MAQGLLYISANGAEKFGSISIFNFFTLYLLISHTEEELL